MNDDTITEIKGDEMRERTEKDNAVALYISDNKKLFHKRIIPQVEERKEIKQEFLIMGPVYNLNRGIPILPCSIHLQRN